MDNLGGVKLKWKDFETKYPKELYSELRQLCEEIHKNKGGWGCNRCYNREGSFCFPCNEIKEVYKERFGVNLDDIISNKKRKK